jgi:ATP:ADP antiporter, AAA family
MGLFFSYAFLLLVSYYLLKTLREPLLLASGSAEIKSYAHATIALVLLFLVPLYGALFRRTERMQLVRCVTGFFLCTLLLFHGLGRAGLDVGFAYYVWVGIFGVAMIAQFWAHAADCFNVASGQRLFPAIVAGTTLGGVCGPLLFRTIYSVLGAWTVMLIAAALLAATLPLIERSRRSVPASSRSEPAPSQPPAQSLFGGFELVLRDRYLLLLAAMAVLLNCVNSIGEYLLSDLVVRHASEQVALEPYLEPDDVIAGIYANFHLAVNALTLFAQVVLVGRIFRWIGVQGAVLVLPAVALIGYALTAFVPLFGILKIVKIFENSTDYSVMNTTRHALYLPLPVACKYQGKTTVDTFFWRLGDVVHAVIIFIGLHWLGFGIQQFALLNVGLAVVWLIVAARLAGAYGRKTGAVAPTGAVPQSLREWPWSAARTALPYRRSFATMLVTGAVVIGVSGSAPAEAGGAPLFETAAPLELEISIDMKALCRSPARKGCADAPATLVYTDQAGGERRISASVRPRGRWRSEAGNCRLPPLFVTLEGATDSTVFEGLTVLPLTTPCRWSRQYEQYVLKEYLAYRIYNQLTDKSLRVRLAHITWHDTSRRSKPIVRYGFFAEHFDVLARRSEAAVWATEKFDPRLFDPFEVATVDLFQYMIGNTDWSAMHAHNVVLIRDEGGLVTPVPYDFDFSGLVNAEYAGPPPQLKIRDVRQRLFRGLCRSDIAWDGVFAHFEGQREAVLEQVTLAPHLAPGEARTAAAYLDEFFSTLDSSAQREREIVTACRPEPR